MAFGAKVDPWANIPHSKFFHKNQKIKIINSMKHTKAVYCIGVDMVGNPIYVVHFLEQDMINNKKSTKI